MEPSTVAQSAGDAPADSSNAVAVSRDDAPDLVTRDAILTVVDYRIEKLYVPEWHGNVYLRTITGQGRDEFESSLLDSDRKMTTKNIRAKFVAQCLCDRDGNQIFTEDDVEALGKKSAAGLTRCYNVASEMNVLTNADVDELAKNSGRGATATG